MERVYAVTEINFTISFVIYNFLVLKDTLKIHLNFVRLAQIIFVLCYFLLIFPEVFISIQGSDCRSQMSFLVEVHRINKWFGLEGLSHSSPLPGEGIPCTRPDISGITANHRDYFAYWVSLKVLWM